MKNNSSGIGIILVIALVAILSYFFWKFFKYIIIGGLILLILFIIMLIVSSKKTKSGGASADEEVRQALSKVRQQKFKAENKINRLKEWGNSAIYTTYSSLFGDKFSKMELLDNYEKIKSEYGSQIPESQKTKTDQIVMGYKQHIGLEEIKIQNLNKLQDEYETLRSQIKEAQRNEKTNKKLDSHIKRIKDSETDTSAEETIIKSQFTLEDLSKKVEEKSLYIEQLEELSMKYGEEITTYQLEEYKKEIEKLNKV